MDNRILQMIDRYSSSNKEYAIKEILQEIVLSGLSRSNFFKYVAFYGGTALRIIHKINRFSEDLDFCLYQNIKDFNLNNYKKCIEDELNSFGLNFSFDIRDLDPKFNMARGTIKGNMKEVILTFYPKDKENRYNPEELMKIKLEISLHVDKYARKETIYKIDPLAYQIYAYDLPSLFSSKIAALLTRNYKNRVKGRDYYDYLYYIKLKVIPNLDDLKDKLVKSNLINDSFDLNYSSLINLLINKFKNTDFDSAKKDIRVFIEDPREIELWSEEFFISISKDYFKSITKL